MLVKPPSISHDLARPTVNSHLPTLYTVEVMTKQDASDQQINLPTQYNSSNRIDGNTSPVVSNKNKKRMKTKLNNRNQCANVASLA
mmetsp:Transcript_46347/g.54146  ORF Transcript_46347/g.54146 Transcript_46347/m.54146 type:complete len:86 (-) Transcript_46347:449-706(-)